MTEYGHPWPRMVSARVVFDADGLGSLHVFNERVTRRGNVSVRRIFQSFISTSTGGFSRFTFLFPEHCGQHLTDLVSPSCDPHNVGGDRGGP